MTASGDLVAFLNQEATALSADLSNLPKSVHRAHVRDRLAEAFTFPYRLEARCLVVGERHLSEVPQAVGAQVVVTQQTRFLELVPVGITRDAAALSGPLLVPWDRPLQPGSVVRGFFTLEDPRVHPLDTPGLLAKLEGHDVEVPVEP